MLTGLAGLGLAPLADNGGPTQTMALTLGSPAIGAGTPVAGITTDQRGQPLDSSHPDIGAFQTQPGQVPASRFTVTSTADDGSTGTLRWAVKWANLVASPSTSLHRAGHRAGDDHAVARPARAEQHVAIGHDLRRPGPGAGDHQREQRQPRLPGGPGRDGDALGPDDHGGLDEPITAAA